MKSANSTLYHQTAINLSTQNNMQVWDAAWRKSEENSGTIKVIQTTQVSCVFHSY